MHRKLFMACLLVTLGACSKAPEPLQAIVIKHADGRQTPFQVEIADDNAEREHGLMQRQDLPDQHGMLFLFDDERPLNFWMKNTPLFLDIIFINHDHKIVTIHRKARPYDETVIPSRVPAQIVLEIKGGEAARLGLTEGDTLVIPSSANVTH